MAANADSTREFYHLLKEDISKWPQRDMTIIAGDFNATLSSTSPGVKYSPSQTLANLNSTHMEKFLQEASLIAINTRFPKRNNIHNTFFGPKQRRQRLDYILVTEKWKTAFIDFTTFRAPFTTDHKILLAKGKFKFQAHRKVPAKPRIDWSVLKDETTGNAVAEVINARYSKSDNPDEDYRLFTQLVHEATSHLPKISRRQMTHPWEDELIQKIRRQLAEARRNYRQRPNRKRMSAIRKLGRQLSQQYILNQEQYLTNKCKNIEDLREEQRHKAAWDLINQLGNRTAHNRGHIQANSAEERLQLWRQHFERVLRNDERDSAEPPDVSSIFDTTKLAQLRRSYKINAITDNEIQTALKTLRNGKACGQDGIPPEILKIPGIVGLLKDILNRAYDTGAVPDLWKLQLLVPVPKKGDLSQCDNYRGIALMSLAAKLYNKILLYRLRKVLNGELRSTQNGFRPERSTAQHILSLRLLLNSCNDHQDAPCVAAFIDFSKAFDSIKWNYLEAILGVYGVPNKLVRAIMSMYQGTEAKVRTSDGLSDSIPLQKGVLQGDTLAPFLFIIVLDYIIRKAIPDPSIGFKLGSGTMRTAKYATDLAYADDIVITASQVANAQQTLLSLEQTASPTGLKFNRIKTEAMFIPYKQTPEQPLFLSSGPIKWVKDFTYLGSIMESNLLDMKKRIAKSWEAVKLTYRLWKSKLSDTTKAYLFRTLISSILLYGCETWVLTKTQRTTYFSAYNSLLRYCLNIHFSTHTYTSTVYERAQIARPAAVVAKRIVKFVHRTLTGPQQPAQDLLNWQHNYTRTARSKRKISYQEQLLSITGQESTTLSPVSKQARIKETLQHLHSERYMQHILSLYPDDLESFEKINGTNTHTQREAHNRDDEDDAMEFH